ncbi:MAG: nitroreductase family protein [bacterium]|jgi:nitroreductase
MSFLDLAKKRFSVRRFETTPVPEEALEAILEAGRLAPSAANRQPCHLIVVRSEEQRRKLGVAYPRDWFWQAPVIIVICVETSRAWIRSDNKSYGDVDGALVVDHMTLCAADLGLGTCWIGAFDPAKVRSLLNLPAGMEPLAMIPLGTPAEPVRSKSRKPLAEMVHQETW